MNLSRKRSASPPSGVASPTLTGAPATQDELDQLTAMHILKRQRLAHAAAAAQAAEASLFRPSLMDMNMGAHMGGHMSSLYHGMNMSSHMNAMNMNAMNMSAMTSMNAGAMNPPLFHPGSTAARLRLAGAAGSLSPYYSPSAAASGTISPMASTHLSWRAQAAINQGADGMPVLPSLGRGFTSLDSSQRLRSGSPSSLPQPQEETGLDQLSAFASHMPSMPVRKAAVDAPASTNISNSSSNGKDDHMLCAPVHSGKATPPTPLTLKTVLQAKKLTRPVMDTSAKALHWEDRPFVPLAVPEDSNWLSEFQCFLRSEILEVFIASPRDLETRAVAGASKKKIATAQVGIRCRFCAHLHPTERASRASAFPSSVRQIYQSFTMMLREHLNGQCEAFPEDIKQHFAKLKGQSAQSASDSKRYWIYAAQKLGMVDTPEAGIQMNDENDDTTAKMKAFGASAELQADLKVALAEEGDSALAIEADQPVVAEFTYTVVRQAVKVHLAASEKIGNRSCLTVGLPGLACKHCALAGRSGLSRVFPARKRNLKTKVHDLYDHLRRCDLTPDAVKEQLQKTLASDSDKKSKVFYARLWRRLGHESDDGKSPILEATSSSRAATGAISPISSSL